MARTIRNKRIIVRQIQSHFRSEYQHWMNPASACLYWTRSTVTILSLMKTRAIIQAGSCSWPRIHPNQDNGVSPTHFTYKWQPSHIMSKIAVALGQLPEIHVWAAIPETQEIIDLTTGFWPGRCKELLGEDWPGPKPPEWFWGTADELPDWVRYEPNLEAIDTALQYLALSSARL